MASVGSRSTVMGGNFACNANPPCRTARNHVIRSFRTAANYIEHMVLVHLEDPQINAIIAICQGHTEDNDPMPPLGDDPEMFDSREQLNDYREQPISRGQPNDYREQPFSREQLNGYPPQPISRQQNVRDTAQAYNQLTAQNLAKVGLKKGSGEDLSRQMSASRI
jgi:hypothetical protein